MRVSFVNDGSSKRAPSGAIVVSILVHVGIAAALLSVPMDLRYLDRLFVGTPAHREGDRDRIIYIGTAPSSAAATTSSRALPAGPQARRATYGPLTSATPTAPVIAGAPGARVGVAKGGDPTDPGGVVLVPVSADPRIWNAEAAYNPPSPTHAAVLEASLRRAIASANDSIARLGVQNVRPDWLIGPEGRRLGVARDRIHLGRVDVPAVAMGLAPIPGFGCMPKMFFPDRPVRDSVGIVCMQLENSVLAERAERINEMSAEIRARAPLAAAARDEITRIALRKDRERAARLRSQQGVPRAIPPDR